MFEASPSQAFEGAPFVARLAGMVELVRTNDAVLLTALDALLAAAGIEAIVLDQYTSALEGSIGALPRRLMVHEEDEGEARALLNEAGYARELRPAR
jgi:hypothetical protein